MQVFNGNISKWNVSKVRDMSYMFYEAKKFNQDISSWNVSNVRNMYMMLCNAKDFDGNISTWNVSNVERNTDFAKGAPIELKENKLPKFSKYVW